MDANVLINLKLQNLLLLNDDKNRFKGISGDNTKHYSLKHYQSAEVKTEPIAIKFILFRKSNL